MSHLFLAPAWALILMITLGVIVIACGGHVLVHRHFARINFIEHNEVAGFVVAIVGVLYAVLVGFVTIVVWEHYAAASDRAILEVNAATDIWRLANYTGDADRNRLTNDLDVYVLSVIREEWPAMAEGHGSKHSELLVTRLLRDAVEMPATTIAAGNVQNRLLDRVQAVADLRRRRLSDDVAGVPPVLWAALIAGAAAVIGFLYLFGLKNFRVQLLMTAATATVIGLSFSVVIALNYPFRAYTAITPDRWIALHDEITAGNLPARSPAAAQ
jgi:hypothetical protein